MIEPNTFYSDDDGGNYTPHEKLGGCGWLIFAVIVTWLACLTVGWYLWDMVKEIR